MANIESIQTVETLLPTLTLSEATASHLGGISVTGNLPVHLRALNTAYY